MKNIDKQAAAFYRTLLEQICEDTRRTRARRLAESGLMFWDANWMAEKSKREGKRETVER